ncbi:MAG: helix-turn-helix domain-containing protein [Phenylobacterium sp.]|uniref:AraC family transcriptional regulator n=1 Tax=Phenylobacterium sp. TaxID=1871053 RepID=UPI00391E0173
MALALFCLDLLTIAALLLIGGRILAAFPRRGEGWLVFLVCLAGMAHVALARAEYGYWIPEPYRFRFGGAEPALDVIRNMAPGLFALLAFALFADRRRPPLWLGGLLVLQAALEIAPYLVGAERALNAASALLQVAFAGLAIGWTLAYWRVDLIEARRRSRAFLAILLAVNGVASSILLRLVIPAETRANYQGHAALMVLTAALVLLLLIRLMDGDFGPYLGAEPRRRPGAAEAREQEDDLALARLRRLLDQDKIHHEPRLSLARLADRVGVPEYRLRRLIHERLGYRNFNAFLHAYRVAEAARRLSDPAERRTPILTIALSSGYESINTFNRGFRDVMGLSPSEYRARQLARKSGAPDAPESA